MNKYKVIYLDAFTTTPFCGNPCAVLPSADGLSSEQMQQIAKETNLPETAFVLKSDKADFRVRYFMPRVEIPFAGHPTIATAFMLAQEGMIDLVEPVTEIKMEFEVGVLPVYIEVKNGVPVNAEMVQKKPVFGKTIEAEELAPCFYLEASDLAAGYTPQVTGTGVDFLMVPVKDLTVLEKIKMDRDLLAEKLDALGVSASFLFTVNGTDESCDVHSRLMDPRGTMEDPFTGSAAGAMGSYMFHKGMIDKSDFRLAQGDFMGRPGRGGLSLSGKPENITEVRLKGPAVKVMEGEFFIA